MPCVDPKDWRLAAGYYPVVGPCCVCRSHVQIGLEPRFLYPVCEEHSKLSPVQINDARTDGK